MWEWSLKGVVTVGVVSAGGRYSGSGLCRGSLQWEWSLQRLITVGVASAEKSLGWEWPLPGVLEVIRVGVASTGCTGSRLCGSGL